MAVTDHHLSIRDAAADVVAAAYPSLTVERLDDLENRLPASLPFIAVCCVGPEQDRPEATTNRSDGIGYSVVVALFAAGVPNGSDPGQAPEITNFRRQVRVSFNNQRLTAVPQVAWCEVSDSGELFDRNEPKFQILSTAVVVTAVGKWPRS